MPTAAAPEAAGESVGPDPIAGVAAQDAERYLLALAAINLSVYDWNIETDVVDHPPLGREFRRRWAEPPSTGAAWTRVVHPDDLPGYRAALRAHLEGETPRLECEYRFLGGDGTWRWIGNTALRCATRTAAPTAWSVRPPTSPRARSAMPHCRQRAPRPNARARTCRHCSTTCATVWGQRRRTAPI